MEDKIWRKQLLSSMYADVIISSPSLYHYIMQSTCMCQCQLPSDCDRDPCQSKSQAFIHDSCCKCTALSCLLVNGYHDNLPICKDGWRASTTDLSLYVADGKIQVHKAIFAAVSPYFRCMLQCQFQENMNGEVYFPEFSFDSMTAIIQYIYTGTAHLKKQNVIEVFMIANYFQMTSFVNYCSAYSKELAWYNPSLGLYRGLHTSCVRHANCEPNMDARLCLPLAAVSLLHGHKDLMLCAFRYAAKHPTEILVSFRNLCSDRPEETSALSSMVTPEVMNMFFHHPELHRTKAVQEDLLELVRLWACHNPSYSLHVTRLLSAAEVCLLLHRHPQLRDTLVLHPDAALRGSEEDDLSFDRLRVQEHLDTTEVVFVLGGQQCGRFCKTMECNGFSGQEWSFEYATPDVLSSLRERHLDLDQHTLDQTQPWGVACDSEEDSTLRPAADTDPVAEVPSDGDDVMDVANGVMKTSAEISCDVSGIIGGGVKVVNNVTPSFNLKDRNLTSHLNDVYARRRQLVQDLRRAGDCSFRIPQMKYKSRTIRECEPVRYGAVVSLGERNTFVVIGGQTGMGKPVAMVSEYCPVSNSWSALPSLPVAVLGGGAAAVDGALYYVGGARVGGDERRVWHLSLGADQWEEVSPLPLVGRSSLGVSSLHGCVYATGGVSQAQAVHRDTVMTQCFKYEPTTDCWTQIASMLEGRSYHACVAYRNLLYCIGGLGQHWTNTVECYDPYTDAWRPVAPMLTVRSSFGATVCGDRIWVTGGFNGTRGTNQVETYNSTTNSWSTQPSMRGERVGGMAATLLLQRWTLSQHDDENLDLT